MAGGDGLIKNPFDLGMNGQASRLQRVGSPKLALIFLM
jgi:hypothetical protein